MADIYKLHDYMCEDVVNFLRILKDSGNVQQDYKICGNERGTSIILRYSKPDHIASTPALALTGHKSPSARRRESRRLRASISKEISSETMPLNSTTDQGVMCDLEPMVTECKHTMTSNNQECVGTFMQTHTDNGVNKVLQDENEASDECDEDINNQTDSDHSVSDVCSEHQNNTYDTHSDQITRSNTKANSAFHQLYHDRRAQADEHKKDSTVTDYVIGVTDEYIVQFHRFTWDVRVLDAKDPDYHTLMTVTQKWKPLDPLETTQSCQRFESEYFMMTKVLEKLLITQMHTWLHIDHFSPYD